MVAGAPRSVSLPPDEMIALGKEMIQWIKDNKPLHIKQWYSIEKCYLYEEWKAMIQCKEFLPYYEQAINLISIQYIDKTSNIRDSVSHRFLRLYYKDVKNQEDEDAKDVADLAKKSISDIPPLTDQIDKQNQEMSENARLRKRIAELESKFIQNQS